MARLLLINGIVGIVASLSIRFVPTSQLPASALWLGLMGVLAGLLIRARQRGGYVIGAVHFALQAFSYFSAGMRWWFPSGFSLGVTISVAQGTLFVNFIALAGLVGVMLAASSGVDRRTPAVAQKS